MRTVVRGGMVVTMDPGRRDLPRGDVLVEDGRIAEVAAPIDAADAEVIDARGMIVMPGFVDTHRHTWQTAFRGIGADWTFDQYRAAMHGTLRPHYRPEDVYLGNLLGRIEALHSGVTTMLDWFHCADRPENAALSPDPAAQVHLTGRRAVADGVAGDHLGLHARRLGRRVLVRPDDDVSSGQPLADVVVGVAHQVMDTPGQERASD